MVKRMQLCELWAQVIHEYPPSQKRSVIPLLWLGLLWFFIQNSKTGRKNSFIFLCTLHTNGTQYEISSNVADVHRNNCVCPVRLKWFVGAYKLKTMATFCTHSNWFNFWFHCWVIMVLRFCLLGFGLWSKYWIHSICFSFALVAL